MRDYPTDHRMEFEKEWNKTLNRFAQDFLNNFGDPDGNIDWEKLLRFNSGKDKVPWISKLVPVISTEDQDDDSSDDESDEIDTDG